MACIAVLAQPMAVTTTRFTRETCCEASAWWRPEFNSESRPLRMNWVVVVDNKSSRRLRMNWAADQELKQALGLVMFL
ncbi:MAG: hypothetical protein ABR874_08725 [Candidatus Sulfotelmatobacter sp.]|jgi:hypothetical protein